MPQVPMPNSGGTSETGDTNGPAGQPNQPGGQQFGGGEIQLSKQESAALAALHFASKDPRLARERARRESGLTHNQLTQLQARAELARSKGIALRGERFILKPTKPGDPDMPGLLRGDVTGKDAEDAKKAKAEEKAPKKEMHNTMRRSYAGRKVADATPAKKK